MVPWWLPVDLPNISSNTDYFEMWLVSIERSFQGLSVAIETVRIIEELMEIWPNEVCNTVKSLTEVNVNDYVAIFFVGEHGQVINLVIDPDCTRLVEGRQVYYSCLPRSYISSYSSFTYVSATHWPVWFSVLISARINRKSIFSGKKVTRFCYKKWLLNSIMEV